MTQYFFWFALGCAIMCFLLGYIEPRPAISIRYAAGALAWTILAAIVSALP